MKEKKKKVLICLQDFQHGGIPKSLENLLALMDGDRYQLEIFCAWQEGSCRDCFSGFTVLKQNRLLWYICANYRKLTGGRKLLAVGVKAFRALLMKGGVDLFLLLQKKIAARLSKRGYDVVIAYAEGYITRFSSFIETPRRIAWIHLDYRRYLTYVKGEDETAVYARFHRVVSPSAFSARSFGEVFPQYAGKTVVIPNLLETDRIIRASGERRDMDSRFRTDEFTIVSVGRICAEKRFHEIPRIARQLRDRGLSFKWYVIGGGSDVETAFLDRRIREADMEDRVIKLGAKDNPYPYIAGADLVVMLSISETFSYVINEAKVLGVPVVATDFGSAAEIMNEDCGLVLPLEELHAGIGRMMTDAEFRRNTERKLESFRYDNAALLETIYDMIDRQ